MPKQVMIKKDAIMSIEVGTQLFSHLNELFVYIVSEHSEEELLKFKELAEKGSPITEPWMTHLQALQTLIVGFQQSAIDKGMTYEQEVEELDITEEGD